MTIKSKLLKHLSDSDNNPQQWSDLSFEEKATTKRVGLFYAIVTSTFSLAAAIAIDEIRNTPEGCVPVIFPEQAYLKQREHCKRDYSERPLFGLGFGTSGTLAPTR